MDGSADKGACHQGDKQTPKFSSDLYNLAVVGALPHRQTDLKNQGRAKTSWTVNMKISELKSLCLSNTGLLNTKFWERALSDVV